MKQKNIKGLISEYFIFLIFIALVVVLTCLKPSFIAPTNLVNILKQASINGILAFGMMFVIIAGGFDMSVGSTVAFTGILAALLGKLVQQGKAVIMISSEIPELMGVCDRIMVMCEGNLSGEVQRDAFSQERIMTLASAIEV